METLNYQIGTKITNVSVEPKINFVVTMVSDKKVSMKRDEDRNFFWKGGQGKNKLAAYTQTKESFEKNIKEGRLVIN